MFSLEWTNHGASRRYWGAYWPTKPLQGATHAGLPLRATAQSTNGGHCQASTNGILGPLLTKNANILITYFHPAAPLSNTEPDHELLMSPWGALTRMLSSSPTTDFTVDKCFRQMCPQDCSNSTTTFAHYCLSVFSPIGAYDWPTFGIRCVSSHITWPLLFPEKHLYPRSFRQPQTLTCDRLMVKKQTADGCLETLSLYIYMYCFDEVYLIRNPFE